MAKLSDEVFLKSLYGQFLRVGKLTDARAISWVRAVQLVANLTIFARNTDSTAGIDTTFTCFPSFRFILWKAQYRLNKKGPATEEFRKLLSPVNTRKIDISVKRLFHVGQNVLTSLWNVFVM